MTLFEKIYLTILIINVALCIINGIGSIDGFPTVIDWAEETFGLQILLTLAYLVVKLVLWIWGIHIDLFPSIRLL